LKIELSEVINHPVSDLFTFYADDHLQNHPRWDPEMQLSLATDGDVGVGTVFNRRHTHFGDPVEGSMRVIDFERDELFGLAVDDGMGVLHMASFRSRREGFHQGLGHGRCSFHARLGRRKSPYRCG
jgi:hypothetical protein